MAIDLDAVKRRIHQHAEGVKREGESVVIKLAPRNDVPAWECWVEWIRPDGWWKRPDTLADSKTLKATLRCR